MLLNFCTRYDEEVYFAITPLQVLTIQRKKNEQQRNTLQSTRPQNYVQCKVTEDTSLHCQMRYPN